MRTGSSGGVPVLSQGTPGFSIATMDLSSLSLSHLLWEEAESLASLHGTTLPGKEMPLGLASHVEVLGVINSIFTRANSLGCKHTGSTLYVPWVFQSMDSKQDTGPAKPPPQSLIPKPFIFHVPGWKSGDACCCCYVAHGGIGIVLLEQLLRWRGSGKMSKCTAG